jgi:AraC-like DNA-binding protein
MTQGQMSPVQTWSTDEVPQHERFQSWSEKVRTLHINWDLTAPDEDDYAAEIRYRGTGNIRIAEVQCSAFTGRRPPRAHGSETIGIQLQVDGEMTCTYGEETFTLTPGDLFIWDRSQGGGFESRGEHRQISLLMPTTRVPPALLAALASLRPLPTGPGTGELALIASHMRGISRELGHLSDDAVNRAINGLLDLLDCALAPNPEASSGHRAALLVEIQKYIASHLGDRDLSVSSIAAAHWISVRTLHTIFAESGTSVARSILRQRLERCRSDLASATDATTVTSVAYRWGFSDTAHFSRAFKKEFGVPPTAVMPHLRTPAEKTRN